MVALWFSYDFIMVLQCSVTLFTDSNFDPDPGRANNTSGPGAAMSLKVNRVIP